MYIKYLLNLIKTEGFFNSIIYLWKRNNWMLDFRRLYSYGKEIEIYKPIFLIGNQGEGLTLVSRMIRRNRNLLNITGNYKYWSGADEMVAVMEGMLSENISTTFKNAPTHELFQPPRSWSYAINDLYDFYKKSKNDVLNVDKEKLIYAIKYSIKRHSRNLENPRFIDKSQVFSIKLNFIEKILRNYKPFFVHIMRNPYVSIFRAAIGQAKDMDRLINKIPLNDRVEYCIQHWKNVALHILQNRDHLNYLFIKFEDILKNPEENLEKICQFIEIKFKKTMIPSVNDIIPYGSRFKQRWYPLQTNINEKYMKMIDTNIISQINSQIGELIEKYGYERW